MKNASIGLTAGLLLTVMLVPPAEAEAPPALTPPVDAPVVRGFDMRKGFYGAGNRGIDYGTVAGDGVRAAADGSIAFAGLVAGVLAVTIDHGGGLETTYTGLREIYVERGRGVGRGEWIGTVAGPLHFGVKLHDVYVDPAGYIEALDTGDAIHLIELEGEFPVVAAVRNLFDLPPSPTLAAPRRRCTPRTELRRSSFTEAPNDNVAVVVGGVNESLGPGDRPDAATAAQQLGYPASDTVVFSYSGDPASYERQDTEGDLRAAALRLAGTLERVWATRPGAEVDLIAHSQGGLVARWYLKMRNSLVRQRQPRVAHLVTLATPHRGAPGANEIGDLDDGTLTGGALLNSISTGRLPTATAMLSPLDAAVSTARSYAALWRDGPLGAVPVTGEIPLRLLRRFIPDPRAISVSQMAPGSDFLNELEAEDTLYGVRVLALGGRLDVVVPANHARYPGKVSRAVPGGTHGGIVGDAGAITMAHSFLRDAPRPCLNSDDTIAWRTGRVLAGLQDKVDGAYALAEDAVIARLAAGGSARRLLKGGRGLIGDAHRVWRAGGTGALARWGRGRAVELGAWARRAVGSTRDPRTLGAALRRHLEGRLVQRAREELIRQVVRIAAGPGARKVWQ